MMYISYWLCVVEICIVFVFCVVVGLGMGFVIINNIVLKDILLINQNDYYIYWGFLIMFFCFQLVMWVVMRCLIILL